LAEARQRLLAMARGDEPDAELALFPRFLAWHRSNATYRAPNVIESPGRAALRAQGCACGTQAPKSPQFNIGLSTVSTSRWGMNSGPKLDCGIAAPA
jgi:hypothetical protein